MMLGYPTVSLLRKPGMLQEDPGFPLLWQRPEAQIGATREALHGALLGGAEGDFKTPGGRLVIRMDLPKLRFTLW